MGTETKVPFKPEVYIDQMKRCDIETLTQIKQALDCDLDFEELRQLCRHMNTSAAGIVRLLGNELGI